VLVGSLVVLSLTKQSFSEYQSEQPREPILKAAADQSMRVGHFGRKADPLNNGCQIVKGDEKWLCDASPWGRLPPDSMSKYYQDDGVDSSPLPRVDIFSTT